MKHTWTNTLVTLSVFGVMVIVGDTFAETNNYPAGARVLDATYKLVGPVIGIDSAASNPIVALNVSGSSIILEVTRDSFQAHTTLYFSGENCRGQAYIGIASTSPSEQSQATGQAALAPTDGSEMSPNTAPTAKARHAQPGVAELLMSMAKSGDDPLPSLFPHVSVMKNVVYGQRANTSPAPVTVASSYNSLNANSGCQPSNRTSNMVMADPLIDLGSEFKPPFSFVYP